MMTVSGKLYTVVEVMKKVMKGMGTCKTYVAETKNRKNARMTYGPLSKYLRKRVIKLMKAPFS